MEYKLKGESAAKKVEMEDRERVADEIAIGPYTGGAMTERGQVLFYLQAKPKVQKLMKMADAAAKAWSDENGAIEDGGKHWQCREHETITNISMSLVDFMSMLHDLGMSETDCDKIEDALVRRGFGVSKVLRRYGWGE